MKKPGKKAPAGYVNPHADDNLKELSRLQRTIGQASRTDAVAASGVRLGGPPLRCCPPGRALLGRAGAPAARGPRPWA